MFTMLTENQFNASLGSGEAYNALLSMKDFPEIVQVKISEMTPPFWNILQRVFFLIFGTSEIAIRSLSVFCLLLTAFFTYKIAVHMWGKKTGLLAFAMTTLNPFLFTYAFEGSLYVLLVLCVTASMYFYITQKWKSYVVASVLALYTHQYAIFIFVIQGLWIIYELLSKKKERVKKRLKAFAVIGILYLPWIWPLYAQTRRLNTEFALSLPTIDEIQTLVFSFLAQGLKTDTLTVPFTHYKLYELSLYLVLLGLAMRRWEKSIKNTLFLLLWVICPLLLAWLFSFYFQPIFVDRFLIYIIPALMLILASRGRKYSGFVTGIILIVFGIMDFRYFTHPTKLPIKELSLYINENKEENDIFINKDIESHHLWESKYYGIEAFLYVPDLSMRPDTKLLKLNDEDILISLPHSAQRIGIISSNSLENYNLEGFEKSEEIKFDELIFSWYERIK